MNNFLNNLKKEAQHIRLSKQEKAVMRAQIFGLEAPIAAATSSPYVMFSFSLRSMVALSLVFVVLAGSGTVYAAQGAVPGDVLYTVKVSITEPVREALAFSDEAKIEFHIEVAEERLEEAEALASEGRLTAAVVAELETSLESHVQEVEVLALKIEEEHPDTAAEVGAELDASLSTHGSILASLGEDSDDDDTKESSRTLARNVQGRSIARLSAQAGGVATIALKMLTPAMETVSFEVNTDATQDTSVTREALPAPASSSPAQVKAAVQLKEKATKAIHEAKSLFGRAQFSLDATTTARVELEFAELDLQMQNGAELERLGDHTGARELYSQVYKDATALAAFLKAEKKFNKNKLRSLLDERFGVREVETKSEAEVELEKKEKEGDDDSDTRGKEDEKDDSDDKKQEDSKPSILPVKIDLGF
jgi:hypothetical protein